MNTRSKREIGTELLSGNEAIAYGALEAGVGFCTSYPGTPSTEIMETLMAHAEEFGYYTEWSTNEKVALEAAAAASWMGIPSICSMKSLGLNVAADFLLNLNLSGSGQGGLVIIVCDDPRGHSSSNEQDSRFYAKAAKLPLIEPTTCQEAKDVMPFAFSISQRHQVPVIVRSTTRLSHSRALVKLEEIVKRDFQMLDAIPDHLYNVPNPHLKHVELDEKLSEIHREFEESTLNTCTEADGDDLLVITTGVGYRYAKEAIQSLNLDATGLVKLVTSYPIPQLPLLRWREEKKHILFIEEGSPFVEEAVLALFAELEIQTSDKQPVTFYGKRDGFIPFYGELNTDIIRSALLKIQEIDRGTDSSDDSLKVPREEAKKLLVPRPLTFCAGCTHRNVYFALKRVKRRLKDKLIVAGDIGCYSLGIFYDRIMDTMQAMGSGIGVASGLGQLHRFGQDNKIVAVAGDSTFFHSCISGIINARHQNADLTFLILDNETTAMTGFQKHPGSASQEEQTRRVSIERIIESIEPDSFETINSEDINLMIDRIHKTVNKKGLKIFHLIGVCRLHQKKKKLVSGKRIQVIAENCKGLDCRICVVDYGCPALEWDGNDNLPKIIDHTCIQCGSCIAVCPHNALVWRK